MSNLEILTLLELAEGSPKDRVRPRAGAVAAATGSLVRWFGTIGQRSLLLLVFLAVWETTPRLGLIDVTFLPPFSEVIAAGWQLAQSGELYDDVGASLLRALSGFLIAIVLFVPLGVLIGMVRPARRLPEPDHRDRAQHGATCAAPCFHPAARHW